MSSNDSIIVQGTRKKKRILMAYQEKFGSEYPESIVTRKKDKISNNTSLHCARMRPSLDKWYQVGDLHLYNVIIRNGIMPHLWGINSSHIYAREVR